MYVRMAETSDSDMEKIALQSSKKFRMNPYAAI